jgi:pyrroloquinoline quinone biosynthesis protein B
LKIRVLGSAAGGGFPQWNCNCRNCAGVRTGTIRALTRTQSSIAVGGERDDEFVLVNASPDILEQIKANRFLQPARQVRDTALRSVVLVDAQVDHTVGLLMLRESARAWPVWCTDAAHRDLTDGNPIFKVLAHYCGISRHAIALNGEEFNVEGAMGVRWRAISLDSKPPPFSPNRAAPIPGDNIGLVLRDERSGRSVFYAPGLGAIDEQTWEYMRSADCVLVDGTFWSDEEMLSLGLSKKLAREMGHLPQSGPEGMIAWLDRLPSTTRKILIHVNNSNPILDEDSWERSQLEEHGIEISFDGMEIEL